ncbi:hypothetical protein M9Y10_014180 [Tritrichomonas musculus]|uniref:Initiator binding domain-containing protein n=1 Tax=Tritrichomonas musculus TaxID=1915356 RepID=A0ABR2KZM7_9EUKA
MIRKLEELKQKVTDKGNKLKLLHVVWLCLKYVSNHPDEKTQVGIFWFDDSSFMLNSSIFGTFVNRKPNTMNRLFRTHGFSYKKSTSSMRDRVYELYPNESLPEPKNWILRWCDGFTKSTTEDEAKKWKKIEIKEIKEIKEVPQKSISIIQSCNEEPIDFNISNNLDFMEMYNPENIAPFNIVDFDNLTKNDYDDFNLLIKKENTPQQIDEDIFSFF